MRILGAAGGNASGQPEPAELAEPAEPDLGAAVRESTRAAVMTPSILLRHRYVKTSGLKNLNAV